MLQIYPQCLLTDFTRFWPFTSFVKTVVTNFIMPQPEHFISGTSHQHPMFELYIVSLIVWAKCVCVALCLSHGKWVSCALLLSYLCSLWGLLGRSGPVLCAVFTSVMKLMQMLFWVQLLYLWNNQVGQKLALKRFWKCQTNSFIIEVNLDTFLRMDCAWGVFQSKSCWGDKTTPVSVRREHMNKSLNQSKKISQGHLKRHRGICASSQEILLTLYTILLEVHACKPVYYTLSQMTPR